MDRNGIDRSQLWVDWVALRKESVDRNRALLAVVAASVASLSARRAWIEIGIGGAKTMAVYVALRKESVDRNVLGFIAKNANSSRSPQGERG